MASPYNKLNNCLSQINGLVDYATTTIGTLYSYTQDTKFPEEKLEIERQMFTALNKNANSCIEHLKAARDNMAALLKATPPRGR